MPSDLVSEIRTARQLLRDEEDRTTTAAIELQNCKRREKAARAELDHRLRLELPGILLWAMEGRRRLLKRGKFLQPASGEADLEQIRDFNSPVGSWLRERANADDWSRRRGAPQRSWNPGNLPPANGQGEFDEFAEHQS